MEIKYNSELSQNIQDVVGKQDTLVSGTNIKTINNITLLGSGNISLPPEVAIQNTEPTDEKLWINPDDDLISLGTEVVNSMSGNETDKAPSVSSVKEYYLPQTVTYTDYITFASGITVNSCSGVKFGNIVFIFYDINKALSTGNNVIGHVNVSLAGACYGASRFTNSSSQLFPASNTALSNGDLRVMCSSNGIASAGTIILILN